MGAIGGGNGVGAGSIRIVPGPGEGERKTRSEALAEVREQGAASAQRPGDRVFYEGDIQYNCDEAFRNLERYQAVESTTPGYDDFEFQFGFAQAERGAQQCIERFGVMPEGGDGDRIGDSETRPSVEAKAKLAKAGWAGWDKGKLPNSGGVSADVVPLLGLGAGTLIVGGGLLVRKVVR